MKSERLLPRAWAARSMSDFCPRLTRRLMFSPRVLLDLGAPRMAPPVMRTINIHHCAYNVNTLFLIASSRARTRWTVSIVNPETVVRWHRAGFRLYWSWLSRHRRLLGRKTISRELRELIFRMVAENPTWGAPRIHGELLKLGSMFPNGPCLAGSGEHREIRNRPNVGRPS